MRYKVKMSESIEFVVEAKTEEEVEEFLRSYTIEEIQAANNDINIIRNEKIVSKTVMPADVDMNNIIEIIP